MSTDTLLVELGTEELPPKALKSLGLAFRDGIVAGLKQRELNYGEVQWFATPRRLAVLVFELQIQAAEKAAAFPVHIEAQVRSGPIHVLGNVSTMQTFGIVARSLNLLRDRSMPPY